MSKYIIGIDIGGTTIKLGIISSNGELFHKWSIPTNTENQGSFIINDIWESIVIKIKSENIIKEDINGIGVGIPGYIDTDSGIVYEAINIGWKNINIKQELKKISGLPVHIENDANIAVLGENWQGAGNQAKHVIAVTLGTGVGGGIITNGEILNGRNGMAGELGHILIEEDGAHCNCGNRGCLETIASATGIVRQAIIKIKENPNSLLANIYNEDQVITSKAVFELAEQGNQEAVDIIAYTSYVLAQTFANLGVILNPEKILIGGGVSKAGQPLLDRITDTFKEIALPNVVRACEIKLAQLGNDAGIIGAAYLVKQNEEEISF